MARRPASTRFTQRDLHVLKGTGGAAEPAARRLTRRLGSVVAGSEPGGGGGESRLSSSSDGNGPCACIGRPGRNVCSCSCGKEIQARRLRAAISGSWLSPALQPARRQPRTAPTAGGGARRLRRPGRPVVDQRRGPTATSSRPTFTPDGAPRLRVALGQRPGGQSRWMVIDGRQVKYAVGRRLPAQRLSPHASVGHPATVLPGNKPMTAVNSIGYLAIAPIPDGLRVKPPLGNPPRHAVGHHHRRPDHFGTEGARSCGPAQPDGKRLRPPGSTRTASKLVLDGRRGSPTPTAVDTPYQPAQRGFAKLLCRAIQRHVRRRGRRAGPAADVATGPL